MEDAEIVMLFWWREETAIPETDRRYGSFCHRIAMNILSDYEDSEECVNDMYLRVWNSIPPQKPVSLPAYLGRIIRNLSISRYRANRSKKRYRGMERMLSELDDCIPSSENVERTIEAERLSESISDWLLSLDLSDRVLFVRRYWHGDSVNSLARECGIMPNQMSQRMLRLRKSLKASLEKEEIAL